MINHFGSQELNKSFGFKCGSSGNNLELRLSFWLGFA